MACELAKWLAEQDRDDETYDAYMWAECVRSS